MSGSETDSLSSRPFPFSHRCSEKTWSVPWSCLTRIMSHQRTTTYWLTPGSRSGRRESKCQQVPTASLSRQSGTPLLFPESLLWMNQFECASFLIAYFYTSEILTVIFGLCSELLQRSPKKCFTPTRESISSVQDWNQQNQVMSTSRSWRRPCVATIWMTWTSTGCMQSTGSWTVWVRNWIYIAHVRHRGTSECFTGANK